MLAMLASMILLVVSGPQESSVRCEKVADTFHLSGRIDAELNTCVQANFGQGVSEIIVDSPGGNADEALLIAERLAGEQFTLRVRGRCSSGCANLFLPLAKRVVVEPGSYVALHGTLDPQQIQREAVAPRDRIIAQGLRDNPHLDTAVLERNYDAEMAKNVALMKRMNAFTERNRIPRGWLFYREPRDRGLGRHVAGRLRNRNPDYVLVEEALMRSCLPHIQIDPYQDGLEATFINNRDRFQSFQRAGGARSGDLVCRFEAD